MQRRGVQLTPRRSAPRQPESSAGANRYKKRAEHRPVPAEPSSVMARRGYRPGANVGGPGPWCCREPAPPALRTGREGAREWRRGAAVPRGRSRCSSIRQPRMRLRPRRGMGRYRRRRRTLRRGRHRHALSLLHGLGLLRDLEVPHGPGLLHDVGPHRLRARGAVEMEIPPAGKETRRPAERSPTVVPPRRRGWRMTHPPPKGRSVLPVRCGPRPPPASARASRPARRRSRPFSGSVFNTNAARSRRPSIGVGDT